ncbi:MAG: carbamoyl-phosphate synthase large subunit [Myxococcota bacterium]|nr:carbamoyl-phosphate synthase large subunit [Myxococcota bacterium]
MPKREDLKSIMIIGSGPIIIGQACEFDYSGTQACKVLKALGYRVILLNSNPATIMTDPDLADVTYIEPLTVEFATQVIEKEKPDALLPTVGGQTALNLAMELEKEGVLKEHNVELIGANVDAINIAEDRQLFKQKMIECGLPVAPSGIATTLREAEELIGDVGLPAIIRPSFTLGGHGGGVAYNLDEFRHIVSQGLVLSPISQVLVERSALGWKEYEFEVMRDIKDNVIIICSIENLDPMGVHTGDSITVAPAQTLTDREYQDLRNMSLQVIRAVGVETGGSNIQFAVDPVSGDSFIIEMNPRVSRSSALASKATGFPIAKIAAQLAVGFTLDEIQNDITRQTPACFEPALDYIVVKIPRWNFEKFPSADPTLGTQMKSVGEVMSLGGSFKEALLKAIASLEGGYEHLEQLTDQDLHEKMAIPSPMRLVAVFQALHRGWDASKIHGITHIDRWFLNELTEIVHMEQSIKGRFLEEISTVELLKAKRMGMSDAQLASLLTCTEESLREYRESLGVLPVYKRVDTCAAEFQSFTPYLYSTYADEDEAGTSPKPPVIILGNGPNRIGQGIEFDYCCCHAAMAVKEAGYTSIMINCNPETVSTDYDTSDKLYFEPISKEHVLSIIKKESPKGVILQFGGQTPLKLSHSVHPILGSSADAIDLCEDRERFNALMKELNIRQPKGALATSRDEAIAATHEIGYPLLLRPSYVLGGRGMHICDNEEDFLSALSEALQVTEDHPVLLDRFLVGATEYDVDALCDGESTYIAGIMEHIEEAGIHSGDSSCVIPPVLLNDECRQEMIVAVKKIANALGVVGLMNVQFAVQSGTVYIIEVNPRASRTIPYVSKATGIPLAKLATRICLGEKLSDIGELKPYGKGMFFIKSPVFPWRRFDIDDITLGPEMRSTGEVMGVGRSFGEAYAKALLGAGLKLPSKGSVFLSLRDQDKPFLSNIAGPLYSMGFHLLATGGTHKILQSLGIPSERVYKVKEGRPNIVDHVRNGKIHLMINTPLGKKSIHDEAAMRIAGLQFGVPCITNLSAAQVIVSALRSIRARELRVLNIQQLDGHRFSLDPNHLT